MTKQKKIPFWLTVTFIILIALGGGALGIFYTIQSLQTPPQQSSKIGGSFRLLSASDSIVNDSIFRGKWMLLYFGASRCPDNICSKTLVKIGKVTDLLGKKSNQLAPIFISYDYEYDTPARLMLYMKPFDSKIIALTGGNYAIRDISILYHAPINKVKVSEKTELIQPYDHFIVMNPNGVYETSINTNDSAEQIADTLNKLIK